MKKATGTFTRNHLTGKSIYLVQNRILAVELSNSISGFSCVDDDECLDKANGCSVYATCINSGKMKNTHFRNLFVFLILEGSWDCVCKKGFAGNGNECDNIERITEILFLDFTTCLKWFNITHLKFLTPNIDECKDAGKCGLNELCEDKIGTFICSCQSGYTRNETDCVDIDECENDTHSCPSHLTCYNIPGDFKCTCGGGYINDGTTCKDVNECLDNLHTCHGSATCNNLDGNYNCTCNSGYFGDGINCSNETYSE